MRIFSISIQNQKGRPNEDFYLVSKKSPIFAVADGVSRIKNPDGSYPKVSGARLSAEEFRRAIVDYLDKNYKNANLKTLKTSFNFANGEIFNLNEKYGINKKLDYLINDYFSTCGAAAFIKKDFLYFIKKPEFRKLFRIYKQSQLLENINKFVKKEIRLQPIKKENEEIFLDDKTLISILI